MGERNRLLRRLKPDAKRCRDAFDRYVVVRRTDTTYGQILD